MRKLLLLTFTFCLAFNCMAQNLPVIKDLRTEYLSNPIGIDIEKPRFSWKMESEIRGASQTAYEINVSTDKSGNNVIWNSGKIKSDKSVHIRYGGNSLQPSTRYYWKVNVWDNKEAKITSNETAFFETGLLNSGWGNAQWIKADANSDAEQNKATGQPARFTLEMDMTLISDNAGIIFSAKDAGNMYMWAINTHDENSPIVRRHIYTNGKIVSDQVSIGNFYSKADLIGKERHIKIDVANNIIKTYIDKKLVDTYTNSGEGLINGLVGFRAYAGNNINEVAYYDNIILKSYFPNSKGELVPIITFAEDFEQGRNSFLIADTKEIKGNTKLNMFTKAGEFRVLQGEEGIPMFRNEFAVEKAIASANIYASALGVYDLFINGQRVGTPTEDNKNISYDELKPGWTDYSKTVHYLTYDVTKLLQQGKNTVGAQVASGWWNGGISHGEYGNPSLGFIAKLIITYTDGSTKVIDTDTSWKSSKSGPVLMADIYNGEIYDARKESSWTIAGYDDSKWEKTTVNTDFKGKLIGFTGPRIQVRTQLELKPATVTTYKGNKENNSTYGEINTIKTVKGTEPIVLKKGETAVYNLNQNMVGWVKFTAKGNAGTKMKLRFGEILNSTGMASRGDDGPAGSVYTANLRSAKATLSYIMKGDKNGETFNPAMTFFGFQYCEITATEDIEIQSLTGEVVGSATEEGSAFNTSSPSVNQLYSNIIWGQRGNYLSIPTDCPQRDERLGWTGDTQIFGRAASYNADVASFFHKWMRDMSDGQRKDGAYPDVAPHSWVGYGQSAWAEAGIVIPWTIYLMYNDLGIIEDNYTSMEKYMSFLAGQAGDGFLYNGAGTNYGDWLSYENTENRYVSVCYYAYAAQLMSKMSNALSLGKDDHYAKKTAEYQHLYENIKKEFQTRYLNADGTLKQASQTAYLLALKLDLFRNENETKKATSYLIQKIADNGNKLSTGFVGTGTLNQTLSQVGATNTAYDLLLQRNNPSWLYSVDQGATTIWERWDSYTIEKGFNTVEMNSFNHYAYGAVSEWMYRFVGGIEADELNPGFKHIILQPSPDTRTQLPQGQERITWADASYKSYYGNIQSKWKMQEGNRIAYSTTVPANTTATLYLPLYNNNDVVYEGNTLAKNANGVTFIGSKDGKAIFKLQSGKYNFDVREK